MAVLYAAKLLLNLPHPWPDCLSGADAPKKETEQSQNGEIAPGVRLLSFFLSLHQKILRSTVEFPPRNRDLYPSVVRRNIQEREAVTKRVVLHKCNTAVCRPQAGGGGGGGKRSARKPS